MNHSCPLCSYRLCSEYFQDKRRQYFQCQRCYLVFVNPRQRLTAAQEKSEYDLHQNNADDPAYRTFLSRLSNPMLERINTGDAGLDFGCGPGPTLSLMFTELGFDMEIYDVFYFDNQAVLEGRYEFITATEVLEHLFEPGMEIERLWRLLVEGGRFGVMTKLLTSLESFSRWHYKNDQTHVCFYSRETFQWLSKHLDAGLEFIGKDTIILSKL